MVREKDIAERDVLRQGGKLSLEGVNIDDEREEYRSTMLMRRRKKSHVRQDLS